jgi:hypothetical protein
MSDNLATGHQVFPPAKSTLFASHCQSAKAILYVVVLLRLTSWFRVKTQPILTKLVYLFATLTPGLHQVHLSGASFSHKEPFS